MVGELEGQGREYFPEIAPVLEIPQTEEARAKLPICKAHLRKCLGDGRLSRSSEAVEPEHVFIPFVVDPVFKLGEDVSSGPLHAPISVPTEVSCVSRMLHPVEQGKVRSLLASRHYVQGGG